ncbi:MAG: GTP-binding protein HSR1 [Hyphomicrobium aestuarii]|nr:GTP-binding protein HSR1 [Hyphomicrobium aestuarii]
MPYGSSETYLRGLMFILSVLLPTTSLVILGSIWLFQNGYVLIWALSAVAFTLIVYAIQYFAFRDLLVPPQAPSDDTDANDDPLAADAWKAVQDVASAAKSSTLTNRDEALALGLRTIEAVARTMHPNDKQPLLKFTVPEALAVIQQVSGQLGTKIAAKIPLGDRLTVKQVAAIYRWSWTAGVAIKAYDLWRIVRLLNPAAALASEVRERLVGQVFEHGREEVAKRLTRLYVETVGRAAIDLYSGRLPAASSAARPTPDPSS